MKKRRFHIDGRFPQEMRDVAGQSNSQDELIRRATSPQLDRKALQLCKQIEREISLILSGELDDDRVRDLLVLSVEPYPRTNLLLVTLQASEILTQSALIQLDSVLASHKVTIRAEVASAINRRKTPELCFRVINPI